MKLLYPNFITKILYESYDKYLILDMEAISLSLSWLLIDTFDSEKTYGINVRLPITSGLVPVSVAGPTVAQLEVFSSSDYL